MCVLARVACKATKRILGKVENRSGRAAPEDKTRPADHAHMTSSVARLKKVARMHCRHRVRHFCGQSGLEWWRLIDDPRTSFPHRYEFEP